MSPTLARHSCGPGLLPRNGNAGAEGAWDYEFEVYRGLSLVVLRALCMELTSWRGEDRD